MIIDAHAHITGPARLWEHFREVASVAPGIRPTPIRLSDDEIRDSVKDQLVDVGSLGTDIQFVVGRPWAIPTALRRESTVMYITQQVNDLFARCVRLFPNRFVGMATLPQVVGVNPRNCVEELDRCVRGAWLYRLQDQLRPGRGHG